MGCGRERRYLSLNQGIGVRGLDLGMLLLEQGVVPKRWESFFFLFFFLFASFLQIRQDRMGLSSTIQEILFSGEKYRARARNRTGQRDRNREGKEAGIFSRQGRDNGTTMNAFLGIIPLIFP